MSSNGSTQYSGIRRACICYRTLNQAEYSKRTFSTPASIPATIPAPISAPIPAAIPASNYSTSVPVSPHSKPNPKNKETFTKLQSSPPLMASAPGGLTESLKNFKMNQESIINTLRSVRNPILDYQEARGVSRNEQITFLNLITSLCTHAYTAAITILVMLWNLAPLLDGFVYMARFSLDKMIEILETKDTKDKALKAAIFTGEIIVIFFVIFMIVGLIFMPVYVLTARIINKIWGMIAW